MSIGNRRVQVNSRERVLSIDINRAQNAAGRDLSEVLRNIFDPELTTDANSDGLESMGLVTAAPLRATVLNGLRARPSNGTVDMFVEPGMAVVVDPDATPDVDDGPTKYVVDPGVQLSGVLTLTAGAVATRIDVLECQRVDTVLEQDNRDLFNPTTGLFTPTLVDKYHAGRFAYRIRTGVAGSGYPGAALGWLPLAIFSVPLTATTWDDVTIWDVRPLAADLTNSPFNSVRTMALPGRQFIRSAISAPMTVFGQVDTTIKGRQAGGQFPTAGVNVATVTTAFHEPGFAFVSGSPYYHWAAFPHSLPRWCKYTTAPALRVPGPFRGIHVISTKGPLNQTGVPVSAISIPTGTGLAGASTTDASIMHAGLGSGATALQATVDGTVTTLVSGTPATITFSDDQIADFTIVDNIRFPANARAIYLKFLVSFPASVNSQSDLPNTVDVYDVTGTFVQFVVYGPRQHLVKTNLIAYDNSFAIRIPIVPTVPDLIGSAPFTRKFRWTYQALATFTAGVPSVSVIGWELGP